MEVSSVIKKKVTTGSWVPGEIFCSLMYYYTCNVVASDKYHRSWHLQIKPLDAIY